MLNKRPRNAGILSRVWLYAAFFILFAFLIYTKWRQFPDLYGLRANFQWEEAQTFFYNARYSDLPQALFGTDFGYLPFPQRLIALLVELLRVPDRLAPAVYHWLVLFLISGLQAAIALPYFRPLVRPDWVRAVIALLFAKEPELGQHVLVNFTYSGSVFLLASLCLADRLTSLSRSSFGIFTATATLLILSKAMYLSFFPAILVVLWRGWTARSRRVAVFAAPMLAACGIQAGYLLYNRPFIAIRAGDSDPVGQAWSIAAYSIKLLSGAMLGWPTEIPWLSYVAATACLAAVIHLARRLYRSDDLDGTVSRTVILAFLVGIANCTLVMLGGRDLVKIGEIPEWNAIKNGQFWQISIGMNALMFGVAILLAHLARGKSAMGWAALTIWLAGIHGVPLMAELTRTPISIPVFSRWSEWERTVPFLRSDSFCIEVAPQAHLNRNCRIVEDILLEEEAMTAELVEFPSGGVPIPRKLQDEAILWVGLVSDPARRTELDRLEFLGERGEIIHVAMPMLPDQGAYSIYALPGPTRGIRTIRLFSKGDVRPSIRYSSLRKRPIWVWAATAPESLNTEKVATFVRTPLYYAQSTYSLLWYGARGVKIGWEYDLDTGVPTALLRSNVDIPTPQGWVGPLLPVPYSVMDRTAGKRILIRIRIGPGLAPSTNEFQIGIIQGQLRQSHSFRLSDRVQEYEIKYSPSASHAAEIIFIAFSPDIHGRNGSLFVHSVHILDE